MKPVICPICNGWGDSEYYPNNACHGCNGYGWVEVREDEKQYQYYCPSKEQKFGPIEELKEKLPPFSYLPPAEDKQWSNRNNSFPDPE